MTGGCSTAKSTKMEMGTNHYGFYNKFALDVERFDPIWVMVDRLTKSVYFLQVLKKYSVAKYT